MERKPLQKIRSPWGRIENPLGTISPAQCWRRTVGDGVLYAIVAHEPQGWHLSISHQRHTAKGAVLVRYPTWDEIADAREQLLPADACFAMHLPPTDQYVAVHDTTFHLHECPEAH